MEIIYQGSRHKTGYYSLVKESPLSASLDSSNVLTLELRHIHIDHKDGSYDIKITLSPEEIGKIVAEFYKQALIKNK